MGLALQMYGTDNTDHLTFSGWGTRPANTPNWLYLTGFMGGGGNGGSGEPNPFDPPWDSPPGTDVAWHSGLWWKYTPASKSYLCPVDIKSPTYVNNLRNNELSSYVMNGSESDFGGGVEYRFSDVWNTGCYMNWEPDENCLGPGNPGAFEFNDGVNYPSAPPSGGEGIGPLHSNKGGNILALDGHVQFILITAFDGDSNIPAGAGPGPGGRTLLWWSPGDSNGH
jgi:prepilin-type processing-associated H-X9-DG protein